ncbi:MAG: prohibitin family protein [Planctomycetes bacterium]|nr:prohibitin family protein [Planctomycetota bacterium]
MNYQLKKQIQIGVGVAFTLIVLLILAQCYVIVPVGHVGVATKFGQVQEETKDEGLHFPVNPLYKWTLFDARQKTHSETASIPSQDQLTTTIDVSVQFRINKNEADAILQDTGTPEDAIRIHLVPKLRSLLREQGKTVNRAEDFFLEETQKQLQDDLTTGLSEYLAPEGITVTEVLIRDVRLPQFITRAIEAKKEREQEVEKQKAELERYTTEQQQLVVSAEAERQAAEQEAIKKKTLADAQAYEIQKINEAIADNPAYIQLKALEALQSISKDPAAKVYFLNSDSPNPLPLLHMGDVINPIK